MHNGCFNILKSVNVIHHIKSPKKKNNMILSIDAEKAHTHTHTHTQNKNKNKNSHQVMKGKEFPQSQNKGIYKTSTTSITLNGKTLDIFPRRTGEKSKLSTLTAPIQYPAGSVSQCNMVAGYKANIAK